MEQLPNFGDERQLFWCFQCGGDTRTRDHVPPKVFLDEPYPENLPVVPACERCNNSLSKDEEYVACLVECAIVGSASEKDVRRERIRQILKHSSALASRLAQARTAVGVETAFAIEAARVKTVLLKLARGHALFELNEPQRDDPSNVCCQPLHVMAREVRERFEAAPRSSIHPELGILPEVGSRAMQRLANLTSHDSDCGSWVVVQPGRYRYLASVDDGVVVRMVISEYLACEVVWQ